MYGYLRLARYSAPAPVMDSYRRSYCSLCHALWTFYGMKPRFMLSFDVTYLAIVLGLEGVVDMKKGPGCYKKLPSGRFDEDWKHLAALTILLAASKLEDDIADDNSLSAKAKFALFRKTVKKAEADYPEARARLKRGFAAMAQAEKRRADADELAARFADITLSAAEWLFDIPGAEKAVLRHALEWIYFADAIDDLERDVKTGAYNPFMKYARTRRELAEKHFELLEGFVSQRMGRLSPALSAFSGGTERDMIILGIVFDTIPAVTGQVLMGGRRGGHAPFMARALERMGGYRLARIQDLH